METATGQGRKQKTKTDKLETEKTRKTKTARQSMRISRANEFGTVVGVRGRSALSGND